MDEQLGQAQVAQPPGDILLQSSVVGEVKPEPEVKEKKSRIDPRLQEGVLDQIDSQLITGGLRIILYLPAFALITLFSAWAFRNSTPSWWADNIQPNLGIDFSMLNIILSEVILLGFFLCLSLHLKRMKLSIQVFKLEVEENKEQNRMVESMQGYDALYNKMKRAVARNRLGLSFTLASIVILAIPYLVDVSQFSTTSFILASFSLMVLGFGQHLTTRSSTFRMSENTGLLKPYTPYSHPSTLVSVFNDLLMTHMDPLMRAQYIDYARTVESYVIPGVDVSFAREKILMTFYRHQQGMSLGEMQSELAEVLTGQGLQFVLEHEKFSIEDWREIIKHVKQSCQAFFRLVDRIEHDLRIGRDPALPDLVFEVDMENIVNDKANLFTLLHNLSNEEKVVVFRVQTPDFRPKDVSMKYRLMPGESYWWSHENLPRAAQGDEDALGKMSGLLRDGVVGWQTLLPERSGEATVSIRLEEPSGDLLIGKQINVRVKSEFKAMVRSTSSVSSHILGIGGLIYSAILFVVELLGSA